MESRAETLLRLFVGRGQRVNSVNEVSRRSCVKLLYLLPYSPWPPDHGGKLRAWNVITRLASLGFVVDARYIDNGVQERPPDVAGVKWTPYRGRRRVGVPAKMRATFSPLPEPAWEAMSAQLWNSIRHIDYQPDLVLMEQAHMGPYRRAMPHKWRTVLVEQNVETCLTAQMAKFLPRWRTRLRYRLESAKFYHLERIVSRASCAVITMSHVDAHRLGSITGQVPVLVHPNGVDPKRYTFPREPVPKPRPIVLMTGTLGYFPNTDGILWVRRNVAPLVWAQMPSVEFRFVGKDPPSAVLALHDEREGSRFIVVGWVKDVRPELEQADVFVVPLRLGSGTRLKALEACASGIPVVGTEIGLEGLNVPTWMVATTATDMAQRVLALLSNTDLAAERGREARALAVQYYNWDLLVPRLAEDLLALI